MSFLTMADSADNSQFPAGFGAYAGYVDGHVGNQPNYGWVTRNMPGFHLSISVFGNDADCLDIETGAATVAMAAQWYARQVARKAYRPVFYASASLMNSDLIPAIRAAGIDRSKIRLWSAHYTGHAHICGPRSCGLLGTDADGTQWTDHAGSLNADQSLLLPDFFGPADPGFLTDQEMSVIMNKLPVLQLPPPGQPPMSDATLPHWYIRRLQLVLKGIYSLYTGSLDGVYGPVTAEAVKALQGKYGLAQDQICGPQTWSYVVAGEA